MTLAPCFDERHRPHFLGRALLGVAMTFFSVTRVTAAEPEVATLPHVNATARAGLYPGNRDPLAPSPLIKLPIGAIKPRGWLGHMLELERDGMTGHLEEISPWLNFSRSAWGNKEGKGERGWEELPYWLKGFGDLGYVLKDETVITKARKWIEAVLSSQREDGWFGPRDLLTSLDGKPDLWPHMVMLNVLQSYYEFSDDARVLPFMTRYLQWENRLPPSAFGEGYWPRIRAGDNIETAYWLYNRTGDPWLLDLAQKIHEHMARWDANAINWHNVNFAQGFRAGTVFWMQSRDPKHLDSAERNYDQALDTYGQFPGGTFVADENARPGYTDPRGGFETCGMVEFMHSFEMLTKITGNPLWADRCEGIAFNSFPASMTPDEKALHYLTCVNQIQLDRRNKSPGVQNGGNMFGYMPYEDPCRCCQHNVSHGWPYYAEELWLATHDRGLCASLYAESEVTAKVGDGTRITIAEQTDYPFSDLITLKLSAPKAVKFPLYLRVPRGCERANFKVNGKPLDVKAQSLSFVIVNREWQDGDVVVAQFPMRLTVRTWAKNKDSVSVDYGPLSFSLKIDERWEKFGDRKPDWPQWEVFPASAWNYGLVLDRQDPAKSFEIVRRPGALPAQPFTPENAPIQLKVRARKIPAWQADRLNMVGLLQPSPARTSEPEETVTLVPMGAARLRIASFPTATTGPEGHEWIASAKARPAAYKASASHCFENDTVDALADGLEPANSNDQSIPRFTWWDHRGTAEWVQYEFGNAKKVSGVSVYWFDDTGAGQCRVPQSWRVLYKSGADWKPVENARAPGVTRNAWSTEKFDAVETTGLRLEVQLRPGFSGGILEWKVE